MVPELSDVGDFEARISNRGDHAEDEPDLPPEYCQYKDEGCDLADSCLECPFPQCVYEQPRGRQRWLKQLRDREISRLFISQGKGVKELAVMFGVSPRTVQRALKHALEARTKREGDTFE
jgi:DNA-binding CsgD family transcriptional regulator